MISLEEMKRIDPRLQKYSDEELSKIRALLYSLAQLAFETWFDECGSKLSPKVVAKEDCYMPDLPK